MPLLILLHILWLLLGSDAAFAIRSTPDQLRERVLTEARMLLDHSEISYVYGGNNLGQEPECQACNQCLGLNKPEASERFKICPQCGRCSLDCSHFTQLVFQRAGLRSPYLTTEQMITLSPPKLLASYNFLGLSPELSRSEVGDLLVYKGHVVMLERTDSKGRGDIIHVTSGRDLKGPGTAIQRLRFVNLANFRGPLLRILRHRALIEDHAAPPTRLRPLLRRITPRGE